MDSARLEQIQNLFHETADLPEAERVPYLQSACAGDMELFQEVLSLLEEDARPSSLLDQPISNVADQLLADPAQPRQFGPYRVTSLLGEGGMGVVYLAERLDLGSLVAIKILRDAWLSPARRERFSTEQRTLAQLNHPSIARLYDADTLPDGTPWFAMEYVEGLPLTAFCQQHACSIERRLHLFRAVCEAVQYAHGHAVIHRDLKPSNILVKDDGSVRLLDFGIAKHQEALDSTAALTQTGLRLMTPAYAAPEQIRGERASIHNDVYALGVILYELLASRLPFDLSNCTPAEAQTLVVQQDPERPSAIARKQTVQSVSDSSWADLDVLCLTAMHKDVQRRYGSVEALIRDVDHYLANQPLDARPDSLRYRFGKFIRRHRSAVVTSSLAATVVIGLVIFFTVRLAKARNLAEAEAARTQRIQQFMTRLFEGGDEAAGPKDDLRVVTLLDRGLQEARELDSEPAVQADLYQTLGGIYKKLDNLVQSESLLKLALERRQALFGPNHPRVAESLVALGLLRVDQARFDDAEKLVRDGLDMSRRTLPPGDPAIALAASALGRVLSERGSYDKAVEVLGEAVQLRSEGEVTPELAGSIYELANAHFYAGHLKESEALNQKVLSMHRQLYGSRHPRVAEDLINLGAIQYEQGHYPEAETLYRQALEINQSWYGKDNHTTASNLTMLGRALVREERYDEAVDLLQQSLAIQERVYGVEHPRVASAVNELGTVALKRGRLDDAESQFGRMVGIYRKANGDRHYLVAIGLSNIASVYLAKKENARAEKLYREVVERFTTALSPNHLNTGIARIKLGRALVRQHKYGDAETEILAGYAILTKQTSPSITWLQAARQDLVTLYDASGDSAKAARYRAELTAVSAKK
ncbi:serine/threonine-protein kinase [uncultured Paludibaculum sp.]|uniref:serine/threonine-protein kinase n=1 Tax=uncultured Paludibaculum sp. TaxID=1765020 RepID=UPI002AAAA1CC|nr:serine/threonine-protein kinase [uncultured Paludibaculum sp.]